MGLKRQFGWWGRWFANRAYASATVHNTGSTAADYLVVATHENEFTTVELLPRAIFGALSVDRSYAVPVVRVSAAVRVEPGQSHTFPPIEYLGAEGGTLPGQDIFYTLLAFTEDGRYLAATKWKPFGTTFLDEEGQEVFPAEDGEFALEVWPLRSFRAHDPDAGTHRLTLQVVNSLETTVLMNVAQRLPPGAEVRAAAGGVLQGETLRWEMELAPGEIRFLEAAFRVVGDRNVFAPATASLYDPLNQEWLDFDASVRAGERGPLLPPRLTIDGFVPGGFSIWLRDADLGERYQLESSADFFEWTPWRTVQGLQGATELLDTTTGRAQDRFYRVLLLP